MYYRYFGLKDAPFSIAPNPHYLYMSPAHRDALAHLMYGVGAGGGFILLTGEVGTGKTTITRCLLDQLPENTNLAMVFNPALDSRELLATVCDELGIPTDKTERSLKVLTDKLHRYLLDNHSRGRNTVLLIDEAQHLKQEVLEQIRLLTNLETDTKKLLQIILVGQPELNQILAQPELRQLNQRITARYIITPLSADETAAYIHHRLQVAGLAAGQELFPARMMRAIYKETQGLPRLINLVCDRILMGAYGQNKPTLEMPMFNQAAVEVLGNRLPEESTHKRWLLPVLAAGFMAAALIIGWQVGIIQEQSRLASGGFSQNTQLPPRLEDSSVTQVATTSGSAQPQVVALDVDSPAPPQNLWIATRDLALNELGKALRITPLPLTDYCFSLNASYRCSELTASTWDEFRQVNRPAVLKLATSSKVLVYTTLLGIEDNQATLVREGVSQSIPLELLGQLWNGDFILVWKPPEHFNGPIGIWDEGPMVNWLAEKFAELDNQVTPLAESVYNRALETRVKLFQRQHGLVADGVVGLNTLLRLNEVLGVGKSLQLSAILDQSASPIPKLN